VCVIAEPTSVRTAVLRLAEAHDLLHAILGVLHQLPPPDLRAPLSGRARALALLTHLHHADIGDITAVITDNNPPADPLSVCVRVSVLLLTGRSLAHHHDVTHNTSPMNDEPVSK